MASESGERSPWGRSRHQAAALSQEGTSSANFGSSGLIFIKQVAFPYCPIIHQENGSFLFLLCVHICGHCQSSDKGLPPAPTKSSPSYFSDLTSHYSPSHSFHTGLLAIPPINRSVSTPGPLHVLLPLQGTFSSSHAHGSQFQVFTQMLSSQGGLPLPPHLKLHHTLHPSLLSPVPLSFSSAPTTL